MTREQEIESLQSRIDEARRHHRPVDTLIARLFSLRMRQLNEERKMPELQEARDANSTHEIAMSCPCLVCEDNTSTEAAHIRMSDARAAKKNPGVGQKPHDFWCVPLCGRHHREQHEVGEEALFWHRAMIDPLFVALALYVNSGDQEAGEMIIRAQH